MIDDNDDGLDIPDFLKVENRTPLTPEQQARVDEVFSKLAAPKPLAWAPPPEVRERKIARLKNRLARAAEKSMRPTGSVWDVRTARWVMPKEAKEPHVGGETTVQIMERLRSRKMTRPDYENMSGQQLLDAFNAMSANPRKAKFSSKADGVAACDKMWKVKNLDNKIKNLENGATELRKKTAEKPNGDTSPRLQRKIVLVKKENPRKPHSDGHKYFEAMRGEPTILEYLQKFDPADRRKANQWLYNTVKDGHARVQ